MSKKEKLNPILLNCREIDIRKTMNEIIEGYPFVNSHKDLLRQEQFELNKIASIREKKTIMFSFSNQKNNATYASQSNLNKFTMSPGSNL